MIISNDPTDSKSEFSSISTLNLMNSSSTKAEYIKKNCILNIDDELYPHSNPEQPTITTSIKKKISIMKKRSENQTSTVRQKLSKNNFSDTPLLKTVIKERKIESARLTIKNQNHSSSQSESHEAVFSHKRKKFEFIDSDDDDQKINESTYKNDYDYNNDTLPIYKNNKEAGLKQTMKKPIPNNYNYGSNISKIYLWDSNMSNIRCFPVYNESDLGFTRLVQDTLNETVK